MNRRTECAAGARRRTPVRVGLGLAATLLAGSCALVPPARAPSPADELAESRRARELALNEAWRNRRLSELLNTQGRPRLFLDIPGGGSPPGFVVVYWREARTGCIDTFVLGPGSPEPVIRAYQCR